MSETQEAPPSPQNWGEGTSRSIGLPQGGEELSAPPRSGTRPTAKVAPELGAGGPSSRLSPTDVAAWVRLNRCERFLRLQMLDGAGGGPPPAPNAASVLTRAGAAFEAGVEAKLRTLFPSEHWGEGGGAKRPADNARFLGRAASLHNGQQLLLCQPRLEANLGDWQVRGDADLLLLTGTANGLSVLITDIKATARPRVEHRLQVAFYHAIVNKLLTDGGVPVSRVETAILFRGPAEGTAEFPAEREAARACLRLEDALLERVSDAGAYLHEVESLVSGPQSDAARIASLPFDSLSFAFGTHCDACRYAPWCWTNAAETGDLSLVPFLPAPDKRAFRTAGIDTVEQLAALKNVDGYNLITPVDKENAVRTLAGTVGASLDEWVWRARATRRVTADGGERPPRFLPGAGHSTLPHCSAEQNPNLVTVYVDLQHDPLHGRMWGAGSLVVAHEQGVAMRRRASVHLSDGPPDTAGKEESVFGAWIAETLGAVLELASLDADGERTAPVHLVFWSDGQQGALLDALARNFHAMLGAAPALYDFVTQMAAFDSPVATFLDGEVRSRKNYPLLAQSLYNVSRFLRFDWGAWTKTFRERIFDAWQRMDSDDNAGLWMEAKARHSSAVPTEYAYAAWNELPLAPRGKDDPFRAFRHVTKEDLQGFAEARLYAMEHVAADIGGNPLTEKTAFVLPDLATFTERAASLAGALEEFVTIERHSDLAAWKAGCQKAAPRRTLSGTALLVRYVEDDQPLDVAARNAENITRAALAEQQRAAYKLANPNAARVTLPKDQKAQSDWNMDGMEFRLRIETEGTDADVDTLLGLSTLRDGDRCVLFPRTTVDSRLPVDQQKANQPTPKQMLYGPRFTLLRIERENGRAFAVVEAVSQTGGTSKNGYTFSAAPKPLTPGGAYTIDPDPNDFYGLQQRKVVDELCLSETQSAPTNALYARLSRPTENPAADWPDSAADAQARFLTGLDALRDAGAFHDWEPSKREYIGRHGGDGVLLVQGPPGTGKSYSTAFAILARVQGALSANKEFRVLVSCKTHSATDVLLHAAHDAIIQLRALRERFPGLWQTYFHPQLLNVPLLRVSPKTPPPDGILPLAKDGKPSAYTVLKSLPACIAGATPGGVYALVKDKKPMHGRPLCDLLVLDEASQMGLPEACMAALVLKDGGQTIVVGDPRQMPPIVKHAWEQEPRRTFQEYRAFRSLFETLGEMSVPTIKFEESFRLHPVMADFLREEIYHKDSINYHSNRTRTLPDFAHADPFVAAALSPEHPLTVIVHDEARSQTRNAHEQELIGPILAALADRDGHALNAQHGFGVVVPHRAQKAALRTAFPSLTLTDPVTGETVAEAVDTVERYQGEERDVVIVSATESDRDYLQQSAAFLLDPRRLTVALSRAKTKLILVASRSVFGFFSTDEELFQSSLLWKNLLRRACPVLLWEGERDGQQVQIWGSKRSVPEAPQPPQN